MEGPSYTLRKVGSAVTTTTAAGELLLPDGEAGFVCFYFAARFCPPCRTFTPRFSKFYEVTTGGFDY